VTADHCPELRCSPDPEHLRLVSRQDWDAVRQDFKPIYTAPNPDATLIALDELDEN